MVGLFLLASSALAAPGGIGVRYNCVSGVHQAECAQICENLRVSIGELPNPNKNAFPTPEELQQRYRAEEIPYYCHGTPITEAQKSFVGVSKPTQTAISLPEPSLEPTPSAVETVESTASATTSTDISQSEQIAGTSLIERIYGWIYTLLARLHIN